MLFAITLCWISIISRFRFASLVAEPGSQEEEGVRQLKGVAIFDSQSNATTVTNLVNWYKPDNCYAMKQQIRELIEDNPDGYHYTVGDDVELKRNTQLTPATQEEERGAEPNEDPGSKEGRIGKCVTLLKSGITQDMLHSMFYHNDPPKII